MAPTVSTTAFDAAKAEAFANRLMAAVNDASFCLMASLGHRAGLFDALKDQPPLTSAEIAARAGLNERYVREWLGAMVTSGTIEVDEASERYRLPAEHAAFLTRAAGADNMASMMQYIAIMGAVEDDVLACFRAGGGVPYARYPRFHAVAAEDSAQTLIPALEPRILPLVPGLAERLAQGIRALDVGCGSGKAFLKLADLFPNSTFIGMDLSEEATAAAGAEASKRGLRNIAFVTKDLSDFDQTAEPEAFDMVTTFDAIHDQGAPLRVLKGIHRTLRPQGVYIMQDIRGSSHVHANIGHPMGTLLYTVSCLHCMTVSLAQGGEGVGAMWGEEMTRDYLARAGFGKVEKHELPQDILNNWYVMRK